MVQGTMHPTMKIIVSIFLLSSVVGNTYHSSAKLRRDGVLNLYPFPRVGRASHKTWQLPFNDVYLDFEPTEKRQLYAFPRVGRGDMSILRPETLHSEQNQPTGLRRTGDNPGMWFGPRLGRSFKSEEDEITIQTDNHDRSDPELLEPTQDRKKRQTKTF